MAHSLWSARYAVFIHECPHGDPGNVQVRVRKGWFSRRTLSTDSKLVLEACMPISAVTEDERVAEALEAGAVLMRGRQSRD